MLTYIDGTEPQVGDIVRYVGKAAEAYRSRMGRVVRISQKRISVRWPSLSSSRTMLCHYPSNKLRKIGSVDNRQTVMLQS